MAGLMQRTLLGKSTKSVGYVVSCQGYDSEQVVLDSANRDSQLFRNYEDEVIASGVILCEDLQLLLIAVKEHHCKAELGEEKRSIWSFLVSEGQFLKNSLKEMDKVSSKRF